MATIPSQNPVPSELPQDLKFNAGKIDEEVTSTTLEFYIDRLGRNHQTNHGREVAFQGKIADYNIQASEALARFGYITLDSFEDGATLTNAVEVLRWKATGEYFKWQGEFPKEVSSSSSPETTGGIGLGKWVSVGDASLRSALATATGNSLIPTLGSNGYTPVDLDNTGVVDNSEKMNDAIISHSHILLPEGIYRLGDLKLKSFFRFTGSGMPIFDESTGQWSGGTIILGSFDPTSCIGVTIENLGIDAYASGGNGIQGLSADTGYCYVKNVATRANNHGQLWEANDNNPMNTNAIGNIVIEDCVHYGGPNGFVTKHKNVKFIRCQTFGVETQGFVVASDNINYVDPDNHSLGRMYSRAAQTVIRDCYHNNNRLVNTSNEGIRIYSRDYEPATPTVVGLADVQISNFNGIGCAGSIVRVGENASVPSGFSKVKSSDIIFDNMPYNVSPFACVKLDSVNRVQFDNCLFGNQVNVELVNNNNEQINFSKNNRIKAGSTLLGVEKCILTVSDNASSFVPVAGQHIIDVRNTAATSVTGLSYAVPAKEHTILINDNVTVVNLGTPYRGYGTRIGVRYNGASWDVTSLSRKNTYNEYDRSSSVSGNSYNLQITSAGLMTQYINLNAGLTSITASDVTTYLTAGDIVTLRIRSNASGIISIGGWSSTFKGMSILSIDTSTKVLMRFYYDGASLVLMSSTQYT